MYFTHLIIINPKNCIYCNRQTNQTLHNAVNLTLIYFGRHEICLQNRMFYNGLLQWS